MSLLNLGHRMSGLDIANRIDPGIKTNIRCGLEKKKCPKPFDFTVQFFYEGHKNLIKYPSNTIFGAY